MPTPKECVQLERALRAQQGDLGQVTCAPMDPRTGFDLAPVEPGTIVLGAYLEPEQIPGGGAPPAEPIPVADQLAVLSSAFTAARAAGATTVLVALGSPYELARLGAVSDVQLAVFGSSPGSAFPALVEVLSGRREPTGRLPVRLGEGD